MATSETQQVNLRMTPEHAEKLHVLCEVNSRSRTGLLQILIDRAHDELKKKPSARINP